MNNLSAAIDMAAFFVNSVLTTDKSKFLVWHESKQSCFRKDYGGK